MKTIRTHLTFTFDETKVSEAHIKDRLDTLLVDVFTGDVDVHTRWASNMVDSPLFGAARLTSGLARKVRAKKAVR